MEKTIFITLATLLLSVALFWGCKQVAEKGGKAPEPFISSVVHPEWSKSAVLYEINVRQFSEEGTFNAFSEHLPRLKNLGIDILWFMPIHPIGEVNRKGELGSYYSIKDFKDVNPEFGTMDDFKSLITKAQEMGFHIILDWVPNHSSWDNPLVAEHPEWYAKDSSGMMYSPYDWTDVVQFDWTQAGLQEYMIEAMKYWIELGVDGFRVDHPHKTPKDFWDRVRPALEEIRPVFMLAENEDQTYFLEKGFDMNYSWELHHTMNDVAQGKANVKKLLKLFEKEDTIYPENAYRMRFLTNHDENSWAGTIEERMGEAHQAMAVFMFTMRGVPLLYNGQEACLDKRLEFFTRDPIEWKECDLTAFYTNLIQMKKENVALWNGEYGGPMHLIKTSKQKQVLAFSRTRGENRVVVVLNLSKKPVNIKPGFEGLNGEYSELFSQEEITLPLTDSLTLRAWEYRVLIK